MLDEGRSFLGAGWLRLCSYVSMRVRIRREKECLCGCMVLHVSVDLSIENSCDC
jgi:hypothetical protein